MDLPKATNLQIRTARRLYASDEISVDDDAVVSEAGDAVWVQAWVWVSKTELELTDGTDGLGNRLDYFTSTDAAGGCHGGTP